MARLLPRRALGGRDPSVLLVGLATLVLWGVMSVSVMTLPAVPQFVVLVSLVTGIFFFTRPELALLTFFALRALFDLMWWVPVSIAGLNVMELFGGAVSALALVLFILEFRRVRSHPALLPFLPYVAVILIAALRNLDPREGVELLARYISPFLMMYLVTAFYRSRAQRDRMLLVVSGVCSVPILVSLFHLANGQMSTYELDGYNRLVGGYPNLHNHALMMMFITSLGIFWLVQARTRVGRWLVLAYTLGAGLCLGLTYVRTAALGFVCFLFVLGWASGYRRISAWVVALGALGSLASATVRERLSDVAAFLSSLVTSSGPSADLGSGRWAIWTVSFREFLDNPLGDVILGLGLGKHRLLTEPLYQLRFYRQGVGYMDPHNDYLSLLYQMGPIAVFCYVAAQVWVIRAALRLRQISHDRHMRLFAAYMIALCCTVFLTNAVSNAFLSRTTLGWYFWGLAGLLFRDLLEAEGAAEARRLRAAADDAPVPLEAYR